MRDAFTALVGESGPAVLGVLLLGLAAGVACPRLERRVGPSAPWLLAVLIFGSGCWALVWNDGASLASLAIAVLAFALAAWR